jgi:acyl-CoA thioesterase FadM
VVALKKSYAAHQAENVFYREATFYSVAEVETLLRETGYHDLTWVQTLSSPPSETHEIEPIIANTGHGAFLVVRAQNSGETEAARDS